MVGRKQAELLIRRSVCSVVVVDIIVGFSDVVVIAMLALSIDTPFGVNQSSQLLARF